MSQVTVDIPDSLKSRIEEFAARDGSSIQDFILHATKHQIAGLQSLDRLKQEAHGSSREDFEKFLAAVPSAPPIPGDELPE